ncbi:hypothetical protein H0H93_005066, partial [Arthromyces matolae]
MQQKWRLDEDKLTFIILSRTSPSGEQILVDSEASQELSPTDPVVESLPMVGDVNMFLKGSIPRKPSGTSAPECDKEVEDEDEDEEEPFEAEMEIMIA